MSREAFGILTLSKYLGYKNLFSFHPLCTLETITKTMHVTVTWRKNQEGNHLKKITENQVFV